MKYEPADSGLFKIPGTPANYTDDQLASLQTLSDIMATGFHAAKSADSSIEQAGQIARPGAVIGRVGVPMLSSNPTCCSGKTSVCVAELPR